jgi:hypothetical protein
MYRVPRKIFRSRRGEVTGDWRKLCNEELCDLYSAPHILRVVQIKKNEMDEVWERQKLNTGFWFGNPSEGGHCEDAGVDGRIMLKLTLKVYTGRVWAGLMWLRTGTSGGPL